MLEYVNGAIIESIERARMLKAKFPDAKKSSIHFEQLTAKANSEIDQVIQQLVTLFHDVDYSKPDNVQEKFSKLKSIIGELQVLENVIVAAINRQTEDDNYVNLLVRKICKEVNYPLPIPVASGLSQNYYQIFPYYNLLCVPLLEADFLLHLPDLYHELGHPLLALDNPKVERYQEAWGKFNRDIKKYFNDEINRILLNKFGSNEKEIKRRYAWRDSWVKGWSEEFFCDLFATYTLGPAYVWSNLHMCVKMDWDVFDIPNRGISSHPPSDARMKAMLHALKLMGYNNEAGKILIKWNEFVSIIGATPSQEYHIAIQDKFLKSISEYAMLGMRDINCAMAHENSEGGILKLLNGAWISFWENPTEFSVLEKELVKSLKGTV